VNRWTPAYVGVGSNLREPASQVRRAIAAISSWPDVRSTRHSRLYGSRPLAGRDQPDYCNAVVAMLVGGDAPALLRRLRALEIAMGREPVRERWASRVIDLDLLAFGGEQRRDPDLTLPHAGVVERSFVLYPLAELAPDLWLSGMGRVATLARALPADGLWLIEAGSLAEKSA
jgi:2-amino-4-hydroxy-6-hydroxymethyldihydropteridine diphosphokinase